MRTITERIAKRIRRGQPWGGVVPDALILKWAEQYGKTLRQLRKSRRG